MRDLKIFEYEGSVIQFDLVDGKIMANATLMASAFNKKPDDIFKTKTWGEYEGALLETKNLRFEDIRTVKNGENGGSWIHQELIVEFARRLNPRFSIQCNDWIAELLRTGKVELKPMTTADMFMMQAQFNKEYETRIIQVESKVDHLMKVHEEGSTEILLLDRSTDKMPEETLRVKIRKLVSAYCRAKLARQQDAWNLIYERLYYRYSIAIKKYKKKSGETYLDVAERNDFLDKIFVIASNELTI